MMYMEVFKDIEGYEGLYQVSNYGNVLSVKRNKFLKPAEQCCGYYKIALSKKCIVKSFLVHILVAQAFLENPDNLPVVNHLDENRKNNNVSNLEWCTVEHNINYGTRTKRATQTQLNRTDCSKPVLQFDKNGKFIKEYPSTQEAKRETGASKISRVCKGKAYSSKGFIWRYK